MAGRDACHRSDLGRVFFDGYLGRTERFSDALEDLAGTGNFGLEGLDAPRLCLMRMIAHNPAEWADRCLHCGTSGLRRNADQECKGGAGDSSVMRSPFSSGVIR